MIKTTIKNNIFRAKEMAQQLIARDTLGDDPFASYYLHQGQKQL